MALVPSIGGLVGKHAGHGRQITNIPAHDLEQANDGRLVGRNAHLKDLVTLTAGKSGTAGQAPKICG
jgi:hypothetical protein